MKTIQIISRHYIIFFLAIFLSTSSAALAEESPEEAADRLQKRYDEIHSLSFDFVQDTRGQLSGRPKKGRGQAFFIKDRKSGSDTGKPGMMRWNYSDPDQQVLISDGETFSMYFAALKQMIVSSAESLKQDLTYSFFTGYGNLARDFKILAPTVQLSDMPGAQHRTTVIKLIPKARKSQVSSIHLWITDDSLIRRIELIDHFDTRTILNFSNIKVNTLSPDDAPLMKHLFTFTPPEGTETIYQ